MSKVYLISSGQYSDYHIDMVCATKPIAKRWKRHLDKYDGYDTHNIEERAVFTAKTKIPRLKRRYGSKIVVLLKSTTPQPHLKDPEKGLLEDNVEVVAATKTYEFLPTVEVRSSWVRKDSPHYDNTANLDYLRKASIDYCYNFPLDFYIYSTKSQKVANKIAQDLVPQMVQILEENGYKPIKLVELIKSFPIDAKAIVVSG